MLTKTMGLTFSFLHLVKEQEINSGRRSNKPFSCFARQLTSAQLCVVLHVQQLAPVLLIVKLKNGEQKLYIHPLMCLPFPAVNAIPLSATQANLYLS